MYTINLYLLLIIHCLQRHFRAVIVDLGCDWALLAKLYPMHRLPIIGAQAS